MLQILPIKSKIALYSILITLKERKLKSIKPDIVFPVYQNFVQKMGSKDYTASYHFFVTQLENLRIYGFLKTVNSREKVYKLDMAEDELEKALRKDPDISQILAP